MNERATKRNRPGRQVVRLERAGGGGWWHFKTHQHSFAQNLRLFPALLTFNDDDRITPSLLIGGKKAKPILIGQQCRHGTKSRRNLARRGRDCLSKFGWNSSARGLCNNRWNNLGARPRERQRKFNLHFSIFFRIFSSALDGSIFLPLFSTRNTHAFPGPCPANPLDRRPRGLSLGSRLTSPGNRYQRTADFDTPKIPFSTGCCFPLQYAQTHTGPASRGLKTHFCAHTSLVAAAKN